MLIQPTQKTARLISNVRCKYYLDKRNPMGNVSNIMIKSFKHKGLEEFFYTGSKRGIKPEHASRLERILDRLNAASEIKDMNYPGSFLHQLSGDKRGFYAVKVSGNWRIFFQFIDGDAYAVDYDDYH
jgi:proteic killer suppression protein